MAFLFSRGLILDQHKEPALSRDLRSFVSPTGMRPIGLAPAEDPSALSPEAIIAYAAEAQIIDERDGLPLEEKLRMARLHQAALVVADAIGRLCDGVLSDESCYTAESHQGGLLDYPHYTRPPAWHGREVPPVLLSGHHENIARWRREQALRLTWERRPDMLQAASLTAADRLFLEGVQREKQGKDAGETG